MSGVDGFESYLFAKLNQRNLAEAARAQLRDSKRCYSG